MPSRLRRGTMWRSDTLRRMPGRSRSLSARAFRLVKRSRFMVKRPVIDQTVSPDATVYSCSFPAIKS